ncbi:MAG TPA: hypothetical protein PKH37_00475, partial [Alphaproteobacteria bacterium]|nr:hypothetical protein [Alphaproteobacteria bacterium]
PPQASDPLTPMPVEPEVAQNEEPPLLQEAPSQEPPTLMTSPDVAPESALTPAPVEPAPVADQEPPPMLQPVSDFPSADMIKKVETPASTPELVTATEEAPAPAPVMQEPVPVVEQQGSAELQQALDKIEQLEDSADKDNQVIQGYEDQVTSLKDKIAELEGKLDKAAKESVSTGGKKVVLVKEVEPEVKSETPEKSDSAKEEALVRWVLKGAQPGRALLAAYDQKQADVRTVTVGDKVSGLGTILSIEKGQSGWVVLGTTGKVTQ